MEKCALYNCDNFDGEESRFNRYFWGMNKIAESVTNSTAIHMLVAANK